MQSYKTWRTFEIETVMGNDVENVADDVSFRSNRQICGQSSRHLSIWMGAWTALLAWKFKFFSLNPIFGFA